MTPGSSGGDVDGERVRGERDATPVARRVSLQTRMGNILAVGLMSLLGLGSLSWYYSKALQHPRSVERRVSTNTTPGDVPIPSLGRIDPSASPWRPIDAPGPTAPTATTLAEIPLESTASAPLPAPVAPAVPAPKSAAQLAEERRLSGAVFSPRSTGTSLAEGSAPGAGGRAGGPSWQAISEEGAPAAAGDGPAAAREIGPWLRGVADPAVPARLLATRRLLLPKGAFIDCTLETAIDSSLPGMATCVMASDVFGADGSVVLMERGTKLTGETRGQPQQGAARVFVLWTEARTPAGIVVPLDSAGSDELGRSGLPGRVDSHFWQRFGAAILVSVIDGSVQAAAQSRGGGNVVVNPSGSQDVLTEILKNTIHIPPTVIKDNGDRIQVLVARDLDFRPVYELRTRH